ncbi:DUF5753 domain-containing protein [Actinoplanes sp. NPDC020271]|uniref:DUF5753 domain-containing protein n=1 Tax=Actinoplanes sp. NPDC020271 TaxID=3363896 RepID=UPI00378906C3
MTKMFDVQNSGAFWRLHATEKVATSIFYNQPQLVPGVLQQPAYARAVIAGLSGLPVDDPEVIERLKVRNERHSAFLKRLEGANPPHVHVVLDEAVFRRSPGSAVMREQIEHLIEISRKPTVQVGIIPAEREYHEGLAGMFEVHDTADGSIVFFEGAEGDRILDDDPDRIAGYRDMVGSLMGIAARGDEARRLMSKLIGR